MTRPLPPPRRTVLPVPAGGAAAARVEGRRRRRNALSVGAAAVVVVGASAVGLSALRGGADGDTLRFASPAPPRTPVAGRLSGRVTDLSGRPLARIAVLPADLSRVLTRTAADGSWVAPCGSALLFAAYAPSTPAGRTFERSPGAGNVAWRRADGRCGALLDVRLPVGGAVTGAGQAGRDVRLLRVRATSRDVLPQGPAFAARVAPDGTWRVSGLDTGRYLLEGTSTVVDVTEGSTVAAP